MPIPSVSSLLRRYGITPKKRLGQHFLAARPTMEKIIAALCCTAGDAVVEIGPGLGVMTALVAERAGRVVAVDVDANLLTIARAEFGDRKNITWLHQDILKVRLENLFPPADLRISIIGNLPYQISSPILFWMLDQRRFIARAVIMVQREVAERIVAGPGSKDYGIPSVLLQAFATCTKLFDVSAKSFLPPPEVTSSVVRMDFQEGDCGIGDEAQFRNVVKAAFGQRRKTLRNALRGARASGIDAARLDAALACLGIDPRRRPETLAVAEFIALAGALR